MKKKPGHILIMLMALLIVVQTANGQAADTILVFHPVKNNITMLQFLVSEDILPVSNVHFKGVYHALERYDYRESAAYLEKHPDLPFSLTEINDTFNARQVYEQHSGTPAFRILFNHSIGAILPGGPDIPPELYKEPMNLLTRVTDPWRHYLEVSFVFHLLGGYQDPEFIGLMTSRSDYMLLGICLGMQTLNVGTGGSMVQDIPSEIYQVSDREQITELPACAVHRNYYFDDPSDDTELTGYHVHQVKFISGGQTPFNRASVHDMTPEVLSSHHQAIEKTGKGFEIAALSMDGKIIEAIVHNVYPAVAGVQFHPEKPGIFDSDTIFHVNRDSTINFNRVLKSSGSLEFHDGFWKDIATMIENARESGRINRSR